MKKVKYLVFAFLTLMLIGIQKNVVKAAGVDYNTMKKVISSASEENVLEVLNVNGTLILTSGDDTILSINNEGVMTPHKDGIVSVTIKDDYSNFPVYIMVNINGTYSEDLEDAYDLLPSSVNLDVVPEFAGTTINQYMTGTDYIRDLLYNILPELPEGISYEKQEISGNKLTITLQRMYRSGTEFNGATFDIKSSTKKEVTLNFKSSTQEEKVAIDKALLSIKSQYDCYLNDSFTFITAADPDVQKKMIAASDISKDANNKNITFEMDARMGDDDPNRPMFGGFLRIMMNGKLYAVKEVSFTKSLKIPTIKDGSTIEKAVKTFLEKNLLKSNQQVSVTDQGDGVYQAVITPKSSSPIIGTIMNFFIPRVRATEETILTFKVVQTDDLLASNTINPNTYDNVMTYIIISIMSVLALATCITIIKKSKKN